MVFGWGRDPDPDPERARQALERYREGADLLETGDRSAGLHALETAVDLAADAYTEDGHETHARASLALAEARLDAGDRPNAESALETAVDAGQTAGTPDGLSVAAEASLELGNLADAEDRPDPAAEAFERAIDLGRRSQEPGALVTAAHAAYRLGRQASDRGDVQTAVDRHREAFELGQQADTVPGDRIAATATLETGRLFHGEARFAEAREALERASTLGRTLPDPLSGEVVTRALSQLGRVHRDAGDRSSAQDALERALETDAGAASPLAHELAAGAAWALADLHAERGREDEVEHWYETAATRALQAGDPRGPELAARVNIAWASMHQQAGRDESARDRYAEAARLGERAGTQEGGELARTARSRNVKIASGLTQTIDVHPSPSPGPAPEPSRREPTPTGDQAPMQDDATPEAPPARGNGSPSEETPDRPAGEAREAETGPRGRDDEAPDPDLEGAAHGASPQPFAAGPAGGSVEGVDLVDRAETLHELGLERGHVEHLDEAVALVDRALEERPRDPDLIARRARLGTTLAIRTGDENELEAAVDAFERAFDRYGGRVDPTTHRPGPRFFFDWGRATHALAEQRDTLALYEAARDRLAIGYEMTPRGARHMIALALVARCGFRLAEDTGEEGDYEQVVERYQTLEEAAPFALEAEDHAAWARALAWLAEHRSDASLHERAFERMERAYRHR